MLRHSVWSGVSVLAVPRFSRFRALKGNMLKLVNMFGAIDLTAVTGGMDDLSDAVLAGSALVIASGLVIGAIKFGGPWLISLFKRFTH